jgi:hypothetical protein
MKYDIEGKEIHVGDKVVFVLSTYSTNSLQLGTVLKEDETKVGRPLLIQYGTYPNGEPCTIYIKTPKTRVYVLETKE